MIFLACAFLLIACFIKYLRWSKIISYCEAPKKKDLMAMTSYSNIIDFFLPFHLSNIYKVIKSSRKLKYGLPMALASVVTELILDIAIYSFFKPFIFLSVLIIFLLFGLCFIFKKQVKLLIYK